MTKKTFNILALGVACFFVVQMPIRKVIGEPFPAIFMPGFSYVPPGAGEPMDLTLLSFGVLWKDGQTQTVLYDDIFRTAGGSHGYAIQFNYSDRPIRKPRFHWMIPKALFPGYGPYRTQWFEDDQVKRELGEDLKNRIERWAQRPGEVEAVEVIWTRNTYIVGTDDTIQETEELPRVRFFPMENP